MARLLVIPLGLLLLLGGAILWSGGAVEPRSEFRFINRGDIFTLDINQMSYLQDFRLTYAIREGLYNLDPDTYVPVPAGATGYDLSPDKRVWTFHLRPQVAARGTGANVAPVRLRTSSIKYARFHLWPG